ncbi:transposase [Pseudoduganella rivuli]|uniref:transposase n=1 Tax=Pseudoduganella rivuli TaxID=2666085 RepID=UPI0035306D87
MEKCRVIHPAFFLAFFWGLAPKALSFVSNWQIKGYYRAVASLARLFATRALNSPQKPFQGQWHAGGMPRLLRTPIISAPLHVVQRGHNRCDVFHRENDYLVYLAALQWALQQYRCELHAYTLMTNHVHLLISPADVDSLPRLFMSLGSRYCQYFNQQYQRTGSLWGGRYYASPILSDEQLMRCYRYIELNPMRAGMTNAPSAYHWSSYRCNGEGHPDDLVVPHELYLRLGLDEAARQANYRELCAQALHPQEIAAIRRAVKRGNPLE